MPAGWCRASCWVARKNCRTMTEFLVHRDLEALQHALSRAQWCAAVDAPSTPLDGGECVDQDRQVSVTQSPPVLPAALLPPPSTVPAGARMPTPPLSTAVLRRSVLPASSMTKPLAPLPTALLFVRVAVPVSKAR
jgi:hypothetical protein